jgi:hypothetical protein
MANEITVSMSIRVVNGNANEAINVSSKQFTQAAVGGPAPGYVTVGTTEETISTSEIGTLGWCFMQNLDATNYVRVGFSTGVYGIRLEAGEPALFRLNPGSTIYAIANTGNCKCLFKVFED